MVVRPSFADSAAASYRVTGMDCASCAGKIEKAARSVPGVENVHVSTATQIMTITPAPPNLQDVERAVTGIGYHLHRIPGSDDHSDAAVPSSEPAHQKPAYRRALLIVVALNLGYGAIQMIGGFFSHSQAVKADALDFVGDGAITFLNVGAIAWSLAWRARAAFLQGIFLAILGIGVLAGTGFRILNETPPDVEMMGILGLIALLVNLTSAAVLIPHRSGDSNVRAVWLFSRNDAIGNLAVVLAAGLVHATGTRWPDLIVAALIAALFIHSASSIIADASRDLRPVLSADIKQRQ
jgi:Co/Zn/Cd efflux system component/copper chaperone CopZ